VLRALHPGRSQQELIDLALIRMAWADRFPAPQMLGGDRMRWTLPAALKLPRLTAVPELPPCAPQSGTAQSSGKACSRIVRQLTMREISED